MVRLPKSKAWMVIEKDKKKHQKKKTNNNSETVCAAYFHFPLNSRAKNMYAALVGKKYLAN